MLKVLKDMFCETCGKDNDRNAKFCKSCGSTLGTDKTRSSGGQKTFQPRSQESVGFGDRATGEHLVLHCTLCGGQDFAKDKGRLDSKWGFTSFKIIIQTCQRCGHIELFNKGRSIFDFD